MTEDELEQGIREVRKELTDFDYQELIEELRSTANLIMKFDHARSGYEKVQIFRLLSDLEKVSAGMSKPFTKFINESLHIENEYLMQLNPSEFDSVPEYIIEQCEDAIQLLRPLDESSDEKVDEGSGAQGLSLN